MHVFSFIGLIWQIFKTLSISLSLPHSNLSRPKFVFHSNPIFFKLNLYTINSKVCFLNICFIFFLDYAEIDLGFLNWGFSKKGLGTLFWAKIFKILIRLCPIWWLCICVGPLWHFNNVFRHISMCSCIAYMCSVMLHAMCDEMLMWHFWVVLDSKEFQFLGLPLIELAWHVLIIGCVFYTLPYAH